ncbi:rhodanese-like domain-containing protein [bacterium]|nr:rhodanese-like domain-containing protein [bacterium]
MKKIYIHIFFLCLLAFLACHEGYSSSEGADLEKYLSPEALKELTENPIDSIWIIDVRPSGAYEKGHIPTARSFPSGEIMNRLAELPKGKSLILYCETGGRAQMVIKKLEKAGYTRLMNWGSYKRWKWEYEKVEK